jgi:hypothetical protein
MNNKLPQRDPSGAYRRKVTAARRIGQNKKCGCGEMRPEALIPGTDPTICFSCQRQARGQAPEDDHHFAGEANHWLTIPVPVNDHRAELNVSQYDWPKETRENPDGSPLLAAAGCVRGFVDTVVYLIKKGVLWIAEMLEALEKLLLGKFGPEWWVGTPLEEFAPKGRSEA